MVKNNDLDIYEVIYILAKNIKDKSETKNDFLHKKCSYLLNQTIRQIRLNDDQYRISSNAKELWVKIVGDNQDYMNYYYNEKITINRDYEVALYKGSSKTPYSNEILNANSKVEYNKIFHNEHTIPVSVIIDEILKSDLSKDKIKEIISNISICRMLKEEDRKLSNSSKRVFNLESIYLNEYKNAGIEFTQ